MKHRAKRGRRTAASGVVLCPALVQEICVHDPLGSGISPEVAAGVNKAGPGIRRLRCRIPFVDGKYDAGLPATVPQRQPARLQQGRCRRLAAKALALKTVSL